MEPTNRNIQSLVSMFLNRELLLPEMQRKYVWRATQARNLIDSIYRDYPSGSILFWETENIPEVKTQPFETNQYPISKSILLLDGQQRVTSLASILTGEPVRIKEGTNIKEKSIEIYFNIDHPEEYTQVNEDASGFEVGDLVEGKWIDGEFSPGKITKADANRYYIVYDDGDEGWSDEVRSLSEESKKELFFQIKNKKIENKPNWISITKLFKEGVGSILRDLKMGFDNCNFDKYNQRLNQLYSRKDAYLYPIQIIRGKSYAEVTEIFIRVNSSGTRLKGSDLALAQITSVWPGSMKLFENFVDQCIENNFILDENFLVRCLVCIATDQAKFDNMGQMSLNKLKDSWESTKRGVQNTINFLKNNAFVDSSAFLPSPILLIPLIYYSSKENLSESIETENGFLYWFYNAAIWGRYSSSMESKLAQDLSSMGNKKPWVALTDNIWQVVGKDRKISIEDIRGKSIGSPLFFIMYILARKNQARDFETGNIINYTNFGLNNEIEHDHIFPRSKLDSFFKNKMDNPSERKKIINEIANIAFMTKKGNIRKTNEDPLIYFPKIYNKYNGDDSFTRQQIPYELNLLNYENYQEFLNRRAMMFAEKINEFLGGLK